MNGEHAARGGNCGVRMNGKKATRGADCGVKDEWRAHSKWS